MEEEEEQMDNQFTIASSRALNRVAWDLTSESFVLALSKNLRWRLWKKYEESGCSVFLTLPSFLLR